MLIAKVAKSIFGKKILFDPRIPESYILFLAIQYFVSLIRGAFVLGLKKGSSRQIFVASAVHFRCRSKIFLSKGVRIGRGCTLDGLGDTGISLGVGAKIGEYSVLICSGSLEKIGSHIRLAEQVGLGEFSRIGGSGGVEIGANTIIGQYFSAHPENHIFDNRFQLIKNQGTVRKAISIGENCWIGAKVTVLSGSEIGCGCVVAAGSVVNGVFPDYCVIGGVPARVIKEY
jgi:acetyltransferase-like isoleucine patch superfamily enzyme